METPNTPANEEWQISYKIVLPWKEGFGPSLSPLVGIEYQQDITKYLHILAKAEARCDSVLQDLSCLSSGGKPNQLIPVTPLKACGELFNENHIDCTSQNKVTE